MITVPTTASPAVFFILLGCFLVAGFALVLIAAAVEDGGGSDIASAITGILGLVLLVASAVMGFVGANTSQKADDTVARSVTSQVQKTYGYSLTREQVNSLMSGAQERLNDGSLVRFQFHDHSHLDLVKVKYEQIKR